MLFVLYWRGDLQLIYPSLIAVQVIGEVNEAIKELFGERL
jgi:hypothetical protein